MSWEDCIAWLDMEAGLEEWRDCSDKFEPTPELRGDIALEFLKENEEWVSDIALPIYEHQLEWIAMMFDAASTSKVNQMTSEVIWNYIKHAAHEWLIGCEERSVAW